MQNLEGLALKSPEYIVVIRSMNCRWEYGECLQISKYIQYLYLKFYLTSPSKSTPEGK